MKKPGKETKHRLPKPISSDQVSVLLNRFDDTPSVFWETVDATWDWRTLRRGGRLLERVVQLDEHFVRLGKTHKVCPIVMLFNAGER